MVGGVCADYRLDLDNHCAQVSDGGEGYMTPRNLDEKHHMSMPTELRSRTSHRELRIVDSSSLTHAGEMHPVPGIVLGCSQQLSRKRAG